MSDATEAAAIALYKISCEIGGEPPRWDDISPDSQAVYRMEARAAIEAYEAAMWRPIEEDDGKSDILIAGGVYEDPFHGWECDVEPDSRVIAQRDDSRYGSCKYRGENAGAHDAFYWYRPAHFRPLPEPPRSEK